LPWVGWFPGIELQKATRAFSDSCWRGGNWVRMKTDRIRTDTDSDISDNYICIFFQFPSLRMKTDQIRTDTNSNISNIFEYLFFLPFPSIELGVKLPCASFLRGEGKKKERRELLCGHGGGGDPGGKACGAPGIAVSDKPGFSRGAGPTDSDAVPPALPPRSPLLAWLLPPHYSWPLSLSTPSLPAHLTSSACRFA